MPNNTQKKETNKFSSEKTMLFFLLKVVIIILSVMMPLATIAHETLKGKISTFKTIGKKLEINLNTPVNYTFSLPGDKIIAYLKEDVDLGDNLVIPKGSRVEGLLVSIKDPKRFGIDGAFEVTFNKLVLPSGDSLPIFASATSDSSIERHEKLAKILTYDSALIAYGGINGAIAGVQVGGIPLLISSNGLTAAAGAGVGCATGVIGSIYRKGEAPSLSTIGSSNITLDSDLFVFEDLIKLNSQHLAQRALPKVNEYKGFRFNAPTKKEELEVTINEVKNEKSKTFGDYIVLNFDLKNKSRNKINLSNIVLINEDKQSLIHPDVFLSGKEAFKFASPFDKSNFKLAYITNPKEKYNLAIIDPLDNTEIVRIPLSAISKQDSGFSK